MRMRAVLSATALAATLILGGAGSAMAGGGEDHHSTHSSGDARFGACGLRAAIINGNPIFDEGCFRGSLAWKDEWK
ncbi:hypothetical protein OG422_03160 [Streptomyces sp. NBC_01525]|uniref:Uncharacterized protein n=1 Tax=Streptomyces benahoarensis TaxID=2595054 RepID=A0A553Z226_9ACTN|nr:hypothetical protein [Streptomyces benahoarensis]TSB18219.1 hypothetical protein FNJ62_24755 [Streptomyces benahoarensis]TSB35538.1 hypothetical protein FNZ23_21020 [Streptomyces benahoarensis]